MYAQPPPTYPPPPGEEAAFTTPPPSVPATTTAPPPSSAGAAARALPASWGMRVVAAAPAGSGHLMPPPPPPSSSWAATTPAYPAAHAHAHAHAAYQYQQYAAYAHHYAQTAYQLPPPQYAPAPALAAPGITPAPQASTQGKTPEERLSEEHKALFKKFLKLTKERPSRSRSKSPTKSKKKSSSSSSKEVAHVMDKPIKRERQSSEELPRKDSKKDKLRKRDGSKEKRSSSTKDKENKRSSSKKDEKEKIKDKKEPKPSKAREKEKDKDKKGEENKKRVTDSQRGPSPERVVWKSPIRGRERNRSPSPRRFVSNGDFPPRRSRSRSPRFHRGVKRSLSPGLREQDRGYSPQRKILRPRGPPSPLPRDEYLPILSQKPVEKKAVESTKLEGSADAVRYLRCSPADLYYQRDENNPRVIWATPALKELCAKFEKDLLGIFPKPEAPEDDSVYSEVSEGEGCFGDTENDFSAAGPSKCARKLVKKAKNLSIGSKDDEIDSGDESDSSVSSAKSSDLNEFLEEEERRMKTQPKACSNALHDDLYYNEIHKRNMGPICKCNSKSRKLGIRHGVYVGEEPIKPCEKWSNNADRLYHYKVTLAPPTNFLVKCPTAISHDGHEFLFEGFSLFSHYELHSLPPCQLFRFYIHYTIDFVSQPLLESLATVHELNLFRQYVFFDLLELYDLELKIGLSYEERVKQAWDPVSDDVNCDLFHFMPRFVRQLPDNGQELLSMNYVLDHMLKSWKKMMSPWDLEGKLKLPTSDWADYAESMKGMVVCDPTKRPRSIRVDQLDRDDALVYTSDWLRKRRDRRRSRLNGKQDDLDPLDEDKLYPELVHFGVRPAHLTNEYHKAYREFLKARYLLVNKPRPTPQDKEKLMEMERNLRKLRTQPTMKREVTVAVSTKEFYETGLYCDVVQHLLFLPILVCHLRFHKSLDSLENAMDYRFKNRYLLQLALTHPSYRENYGTNPDHSRNTQTNCGIRQAEYGDRDQYFQAIRKRGIVTLMKIMSQFGTEEEADSETMDNQRLEFFGDAVVEFLTSIHLFFMFPDQEEGSLATFRAALVQNSHLTHLAKILELHKYFLYSHGPDLCLELPLRRAMANCFEALLGAIYLDGGLGAADKLLAHTIFKGEPDMLGVWTQLPRHPLQQQEPNGDRHLIPKIPYLKKLTEFEQDIGVEFNHVRILARAFTDHSVGMTNLTLGSNQRLEFLGDTVLQLIVTEYLYLHFPSHHEGHLSLLRTTLVNNKTQAIVCDELGMARFSLSAPMRKKVVVGESPGEKPPLKMKDKADLLEAYLGALYVDKGLDLCKAFCRVCFFPRLNEFILNQDWNDPKSKLQQCCLTLRSLGESEPDIPVYEVVGCVGPTNTRIYTVAVFFRGEELARASAPSIKQAEMDAAKCALETQRDRFPHLDMLAHRDSNLRKALERVRRQKRYEKKMRSIAGRDVLRNGDDHPGNQANRGNQGRLLPLTECQKDDDGKPRENNVQDGENNQGTGKKKRKHKKKSPVLPGSGVLAASVENSASNGPSGVSKGPGTVIGRVDDTKCPMLGGPGQASMSFVLVAPALPVKPVKMPTPRLKKTQEQPPAP